MATQKLLLPYNFTRLDQKALEFVINTFGKLDNVVVTVFNAYTPIPEIKTDATFVTVKLKESLNYLLQNINKNKAVLYEVKDKLVEAGFSENGVNCIFSPRKKDIATEIIDMATNDNYDIIVLNRKHGRATRFFSVSISNKVMMNLKDLTVCIVS